jgi:hypothetical protein
MRQEANMTDSEQLEVWAEELAKDIAFAPDDWRLILAAIQRGYDLGVASVKTD